MGRSNKANSATALTHLDAKGRARMVDVGAKPVTARVAIAEAYLRMQPATLARIVAGTIEKGEVLTVARIAGIQAAKRTADLIPLCHPLPIEVARVDLAPAGTDRLRIEAQVGVAGKTGVEMEALTAASVAALTVYDMCKAIDRGMVIESITVVEKRGGRSGTYRKASDG